MCLFHTPGLLALYTFAGQFECGPAHFMVDGVQRMHQAACFFVRHISVEQVLLLRLHCHQFTERDACFHIIVTRAVNLSQRCQGGLHQL